MKWRNPEIEKPEEDQKCLFKYKYGIISGTYDSVDDLGYTYIWKEQCYYIHGWIPIEEFEDSIEKEFPNVES